MAYEIVVLKVHEVRFSNSALRVLLQRRRFERATGRPGYKYAVLVIPALFCACAFINDFRYAKEDEKCNQYREGLLADLRLPNVEF